MQFDAGVVGPGQAAAAETDGGHVEVAAVLLHHDVGGDFGRAEEGVLGLVDGECLGDAVGNSRIVVVPAGVELAQADLVGGVAVHLVGGHVDEGRFRAELARGFEEVEGADGVGVEVVEGNFGGEVVRGLGRGVDDAVGAEGSNEVEHGGAIADVDGVVDVVFEGLFEAFLVPGSIAIGTEELAALIVVEAVNGETALVKSLTDFRTDQSCRPGNENRLFGHDWSHVLWRLKAIG